MTRPLVVMGVSGSGKSTLGGALATALGRPFIEGDDLHPAANRRKMAAAIPLTDDDRWPWLERVGRALVGDPADEYPAGAVVSCSALKRLYRDHLRSIAGAVVFVLPHLSRAQLQLRLAGRRDHFMPAALLESQLATLEMPGTDEAAILVDGSVPTDIQVAEAIAALRSPLPGR